MDKDNKKVIGNAGENIAVDHLMKNSYTIVERNFRAGKLGEIDIIAKDGEYICFIEVKTRKDSTHGLPCESVNRKKIAVIRKIASVYLSRKGLNDAYVRFDIVEIVGDLLQESPSIQSINIIKDAF